MTVKSSNIKSVDWDEGDLYVVFNTDERYVYYEVPHIMYRDMLKAKSIGKYFHTHIKNRYNYMKQAKTEKKEEPKLMKCFDEMVNKLEKKGLVRREQDEQGNSRIILSSDICPECGGKCNEILERLKKELRS